MEKKVLLLPRMEPVEEYGETTHTLGNVTSFGVKIDTQQIKSIPISQQESELQALGVNVYEQDDFEQSVINQVDTYLQEKETEVATKALEKELEGIRSELSTTEQELKSLEDQLNEWDDIKVDEYETRRRKDSIIKHRENKVNQYKKLLAREKYAIKRLSNQVTLLKDTSWPDPGGGRKERTPTTCNVGLPLPTDIKINTNSQCNEDCSMWYHDTDNRNHQSTSWHTVGDHLYDVVKARKRQSINIGATDESGNDLDEFVPFDDEESSEEDDGALIELERRRKPLKLKSRKKKLSKHHKDLKVALAKTKPKRKKTRAADDGNDDAYLSRIRLLKLKERLKEKGEWDASYAESLSDDGLGDDMGNFAVSESFKVPCRIWNRLYKYQKTGVKWLWELHSQQAGGIVGDEMGLGKTIQVIGLLAGLSVSKIGRYGSGRIGLGPVLVVCPATVLHQWVKEFHRWWPRFRVAILHETGTFTGRKEILISKIVRTGGILVTSYSNMRIRQDELHSHGWDYIILDEGHKIRNPDAEITLAVKQFTTPHRIILSGSPMQNNLKELWSLIDFVFPGKLGTLPIFMAEFSVPITTGGYANATPVQVQTAYKCACILRDTINPYLLRRFKKDVKANLQLPSKNEQVLFCRLTEEQEKLYKSYLNSREVSAILSNRMKVFPGLIMLRKICNHPDLTSTAGSLEWMKEKAEGNRLSNDHNNSNEIEYEGGYGFWKRSGKLIVTEALLRLWKQQGHRVLLFSQTRQMLDILESFVKEQHYKYQRMDGSTTIASRQPAVDVFNEDTSIFVYLLTTRVGGLGLNLIGADRIIIFDPDWNPSTDTQARERSWRIGQDKPVTIYRLLTTGTIEEKIYHRQIFKQFLANRVLTNPMQRRFFKSNDLFELFTFGDIRPNQATETSAIFAGTGSEINIKAKRNPRRTQLMNNKKVKQEARIKSDVKTERNERTLHQPMTSDVWSVSAADISDISQPNVKQTQSPYCFVKNVNTTDGPNISCQENKDSPPPKKLCLNEENDHDKQFQEDLQVPLLDPPRYRKTQIPSNSTAHKEGRASKEKTILKKKKKKRDAKIEGVRIQNLDRRDIYRRNQQNEDTKGLSSNNERNQTHDEEILKSLFRTTGVHSALKHDKIEDPNNPDFVLVEKEAMRVAQQAAVAIRQSRQECRDSNTGTPTWTGTQGTAGRPGGGPRFGRSSKSLSIINTQKQDKKLSSEKTSDSDNEVGSGSMFTGDGLFKKSKSEEHQVMPSSNLLVSMRKRNFHRNSATNNATFSSVSQLPKTEESKLLTDIRDFVAYRSVTFGQASTQEILKEFGSRIHQTKSALFRELLKQVCYLRKVDGVGMWFLKEEYR